MKQNNILNLKNILSFLLFILIIIWGGITRARTDYFHLSVLSILAGVFVLLGIGKRYYYEGIIKRDINLRIMGGKRWTGKPALIIALFNILFSLLLIIIPLILLIKNIFFK